MASSLLQPTFSGGELSPSLFSRVDIARYGTSLRKCRNLIVRPYGGVENRPGTRFIGEIRDSGEIGRLITFQYSAEIMYVIVVNDGYFEFIYQGAFLESSPGVRTQVAVPYTATEIFDLKFTQSADVMYLTHKSHQPQTLRRITATTFELVAFEGKNGPFTSVNTDEARKMVASADTGIITLTTNTDTFAATDVGSLVYIEQKDLANVNPWEPGDRGVSLGELRRSDGKTYRASELPAGSPTWKQTGANKPVHESGKAWDGPGDTRSAGTDTYTVGVQWEYMHAGYGYAKITEYIDARTVKAIVTSRLPETVVGGLGSPGGTWTFSGDGVTTVFSIAGATSPSAENYTVTISGEPTQSDPYYPGGGGGGGGTCVSIDALVLRDGKLVRAEDVQVGDTLTLFDPETWTSSTGVVSFAETAAAEMVKIVTASMTMLSCSSTAPIPTKRAGLVLAPNLLGHYVPTMVEGRKGWDQVIDIVRLGAGKVRHITVGDRCFWAGDDAARGMILHHNRKREDAGPGGLNP